MCKPVEMTLTVLLAWQLSSEFAAACSCPPQPLPPLGTAPTLRLPYLEGKNSAVFLGVVENVSPKSTSDYKTRWRQMYSEDLSEDRPHLFKECGRARCISCLTPFQRSSIDDLESDVGSFWMTPHRVRFRIKETFAGPATAASISGPARVGLWTLFATTLADG